MTTAARAPNASNFPPLFLQRLAEIVGPSLAEQALSHMQVRHAPCFRVQAPRGSVDEVLQELRALGVHPARLPWCDEAFVCPVEERAALTHSRAAEQGRIYLQNAASLVPVLALQVKPGEVVLDLAAAPGGKTLHLAACMAGQGQLSAVEKVKARFFRLKENLRRHDAMWIRTFLMDGSLVQFKTPERFDRVLLDAPCSSEGRFLAAEPERFARWSERKIAEMVRKQSRLLEAALCALKPGGVAVYSTCSFAPEENEGVIDTVLRRFGDAICVEELPRELRELPDALPGLSHFRAQRFSPALQHSRRLMPNHTQHGFFVARLRKCASFAAPPRGRG